MEKKLALFCVYVLLLPVCNLHATTYQYDFSASNFYNGYLSYTQMKNAPPISTTPISGSVVYESDSMLSSPIEKLYSIDLTIDGYRYNLSDVGIQTNNNISVIGRHNASETDTAASLGGTQAGEHDFWLQGSLFGYSNGDGNFYYNNREMDVLDIFEVETPEIEPTPEPRTFGLFVGVDSPGDWKDTFDKINFLQKNKSL